MLKFNEAKVDAGLSIEVLLQSLVTCLSLLWIMCLIVAHFIWAAERHENTEQFPTDHYNGLDAGLWWAVVTVTTVGYGDKFPVTFYGRMIGTMWALSGIILLGILNATLVSNLTVLDVPVTEYTMNDLQSTTSNYCMSNEIETPITGNVLSNLVRAPTLQACYDQLVAGAVAGVVYDAAVLHCFVHDQKVARETHILKIVDAPFTTAAAVFPSGQRARLLTETLKAHLSSAIVWSQDQPEFADITEKYHFSPAESDSEQITTDPQASFDLTLFIVALVMGVLYATGA